MQQLLNVLPWGSFQIRNAIFYSLSVQLLVITVFHGLPKTHKDKLPPSLRPIISGINSLGERLSWLVDGHLQTLVQRVPGYLRDIKKVLKAFINFTWSSDYIWTTFEVVGLYLCIPNNLAQVAVAFQFRKYSAFPQTFKNFDEC